MNTDKYVLMPINLLSLELKELPQLQKELIIQSNFKKGNENR